MYERIPDYESDFDTDEERACCLRGDCPECDPDAHRDLAAELLAGQREERW